MKIGLRWKLFSSVLQEAEVSVLWLCTPVLTRGVVWTVVAVWGMCQTCGICKLNTPSLPENPD